jgi:hypothetical protein
VNCCPFNLPFGFNSSPLPLSPLPCVNKYCILYTCIKCVRGRVWGSGPQTEKQQPQSPFTRQFFLMTTFCIAFYESYLFCGSKDVHRLWGCKSASMKGEMGRPMSVYILVCGFIPPVLIYEERKLHGILIPRINIVSLSPPPPPLI